MATETTITPRQFCTQYGISATTERRTDNPNAQADAWSKSASHYTVTLRRIGRDGKRRTLTTYYSMGSAHRNPPKVHDVLECLAMDAAGYESARDFEEWANEYGYDPDSRSAERIYITIQQQCAQLRDFLENLYETALYRMRED